MTRDRVQGVSSRELLEAQREAERLYGDILDLPHPVSSCHPRMSLENRAAQFSPFAALTGYEGVIQETARQTHERIELSEDVRAQLDLVLQGLRPGNQVMVTWYVPDERKEGGAYEEATLQVKRVDGVSRMLYGQEGDRISLDDILELKPLRERQD